MLLTKLHVSVDVQYYCFVKIGENYSPDVPNNAMIKTVENNEEMEKGKYLRHALLNSTNIPISNLKIRQFYTPSNSFYFVIV